MDCRLVRERLDAYVDNELEPTPVIEFEQHLDSCSECRSELAWWRLLQQGVAAQPALPRAPARLESRVLEALDEADGKASGAKRWQGMLGSALAVAAAVALYVGGTFNAGRPAVPEVQTASSAVPAELLREIVAQHTDQLPTEIASKRPEEVTQWFRGKTPFRVRSVEFAEPRVRMVGARASYIGSQRAAKLYYRVGNSRVTVMAFPAVGAIAPLRQALHDENEARRLRLRQAQVGDRVVTYDNVQNYTVPMVEHNGVVYAFTGDLDQGTLLQLVGSARLPQ